MSTPAPKSFWRRHWFKFAVATPIVAVFAVIENKNRNAEVCIGFPSYVWSYLELSGFII